MNNCKEHLVCEECGVHFSFLGQSSKYSGNFCIISRKPKFCSSRCRTKVGSNKYKKTEKYRKTLSKYRQTEQYKITAKKANEKYDANNKEKVKAKNRRVKAAWRKRNSEENKRRLREYYAKNRDRMCRKNTEYVLCKRVEDPYFRLVSNLRSRLRNALKDQAACKAGKSFELIGCDSTTLRKHLEKQFTLGMCWDNYGEWHVDHIRPCSSFDLSNEKEQKECFHFTNLQPLWAADNLSKGDSW